MAFIDYYKILGNRQDQPRMPTSKGIPKIGTQIPSRPESDNKEAEQKFKEVNEANEVLSHPENRKKYDQIR